jgi:hypothetical protein
MQQHHVGVLGLHLVEAVPDGAMVVEFEPTGECNLGPSRHQHLGLDAALGSDEIATVDHRARQGTMVDHRAGARPPG